MPILINVVAPIAGLMAASFTVAFAVRRIARNNWAGAVSGGSVIPAAWLIDGLAWLNNMAVDDPAPGNVILGYMIGAPFVLLICSLACLLALRLFGART